MNSIPVELLYFLMFLAIVLLQYLMKRFGPQEPQKPAWDEIPEALEGAPGASAAFGMAGSHTGANAVPKTLLSPPRRRFSRSSLMGSRREVQNAIVVATILGPCRTFESHNIRL